tara:strand:+ start:651 stop:2528 length:1878 start_codon:yes stop_codon:yes gene_type:complete
MDVTAQERENSVRRTIGERGERARSKGETVSSEPMEHAPLLGSRSNGAVDDVEAGSPGGLHPSAKRQSRGMFQRAAVLSVAATLVLFGLVAMVSVRGERSFGVSTLGEEEFDARDDVDLDFVEDMDGGGSEGRWSGGGSGAIDAESAARAWDDAAPESQPSEARTETRTTVNEESDHSDTGGENTGASDDPTPWTNAPEETQAPEQGASEGSDANDGDEQSSSGDVSPSPTVGDAEPTGEPAPTATDTSPEWLPAPTQTAVVKATHGPNEWTFVSPNPKKQKLLRFSPCASPEEAFAQWTTTRLRDDCVVDTDNCQYCVWVNMFDSEYRMNDVVSLRGDNYKLTSHSILMRPEFIGTVLHRMLAQKPKGHDGGIRWGVDEREEAKYNYNFVKDAVGRMECAAPEADTLLLHMRAGDYVNDATKSQNSIDSAVDRMRNYVSTRPDIRRIEISAVLHFGMPDPDDAIYKDHPFQVLKSVDGEAVYAVNDDVLRKNGYAFTKMYEAAKLTGLSVEFSSHDDPDDDMCRYAKACHFMSATRTQGEADTLGTEFNRVSFGDLVGDLHLQLATCPQQRTLAESLEESWRSEGFGDAVDAYNSLGGDPRDTAATQGSGQLGERHWWSGRARR